MTNHPAVLYVEKDSEEGKRVIKLMNNSKLEYQLFQLNESETSEKELPELLCYQGCFNGIKQVDWYINCYSQK